MKTKEKSVIFKTMLRLLPIQILLAAIGSVNTVVSSLFAGNFVGVRAMSAVGLFGPVSMIIGAVSTMLVGGAAILCGEYIGRNEPQKIQNVFSMDIAAAFGAAVIFTVIVGGTGILGLGGIYTDDPSVVPYVNMYFIGQAAGIIPQVLSSQLSAFLSLENKARRTLMASIVLIAANLVLNYLFVYVMQLEALGLALASSCGMWIFFLIQAQYFLSAKASMHFVFSNIMWKETAQIIRIGFPGAAGYGYQAVRGLIVNGLIIHYVGNVGISAFTAANSLLGFVWAVPAGMQAVSRMMISISVGEEDRQTLTDVMRSALYRFVPAMCMIAAFIFVTAEFWTQLYYRDVSDPVYMMTVWGFRILPMCMPLSVICMHFTCYGQASGKNLLTNILAAVDGVIGVALFSVLLMPLIGMNSVYIANVLNGVLTTAVIIVYAVIKNGHIPRNMSELMVIPEDFGVPEEDRIDISLHKMEDAIKVSEQIQNKCLEKGIDERRSYLAGLSMEEMAGNIISHGFTKDKKKHTVDIRVAFKNDDIIMRIKDDCKPFDPQERFRMADDQDKTANIGLRTVFGIARNIDYQNILGMNVLTMKI